MNNHHNHEMPHWSRRFDRFERRRMRAEFRERNRKGEYIWNLIVSIIFLWIVNKIPDWHLSYIRDNYMVILWILNVNIIIRIAGNAMMLVAGFPVIRYIAGIIMEASSFVTLLVVYYIFPFDFSHGPGLDWLNWFLPIALIIGMVVAAVKVISNFWKLIFG